MSSLGAYVFSRRKDFEQLLLDIDLCLVDLGEKLERTRKGRVWTFYSKSGRPFHVNVRSTGAILNEIEDDLLDAGLLPEQAPFTIGVLSSANSVVDRNDMYILLDGLVELSKGTMTEPNT